MKYIYLLFSTVGKNTKETIETSLDQFDQIDQESPCICLLCGKYIRGGEKKNRIGACHRHIGMTPDGHRLDEETICPIAKGGVGMFLLIERTSVS